MKQKTVTIIVALAVLLFLGLVGRYGFTVVKIVDVETAAQSEAFNPVAYVDSIWASNLLPTFEGNSVELSIILSEMQPDLNGIASIDNLTDIANQYGLITVGEAHVYMVRGSGTIVTVNTETSLGTVEVVLDGYNGPIEVLLYVGPRIPSDETSVREAVGFISFGDFREQTEYGMVASEINKKVVSEVLGDVDRDSLMGKTISFTGAFTIRTFNLIQIELNEICIVPVEIELGE